MVVATYLTFDKFKGLTIIPAQYVDRVGKDAPGWVESQLEHWARWIDSKLRKRYASPFAAHDATPPTPPVVQDWLARIVTARVMIKRGINPDDLQQITINEDAANARDEIAEAADGDEGLYDIPVRVDQDGTAVARGGPLAYSEQSPYVWRDDQAEIGRNEDESRRGSSSG